MPPKRKRAAGRVDKVKEYIRNLQQLKNSTDLTDYFKDKDYILFSEYVENINIVLDEITYSEVVLQHFEGLTYFFSKIWPNGSYSKADFEHLLVWLQSIKIPDNLLKKIEDRNVEKIILMLHEIAEFIVSIQTQQVRYALQDHIKDILIEFAQVVDKMAAVDANPIVERIHRALAEYVSSPSSENLNKVKTAIEASNYKALYSELRQQSIQKPFEKAINCKLSSQGNLCLNDLKQHIQSSYELFRTGSAFACITSITQGSGNGKTKLGFELFKSQPVFYVSFANKNSTACPSRSAWAETFLNFFMTKDFFSGLKFYRNEKNPADPKSSMTGACLIAIYCLVLAYFERLDVEVNVAEGFPFKKLVHLMMNSSESSWHTLIRNVFNSKADYFNSVTLKALIDEIQAFLQQKMRHFDNSGRTPFVIIFDEAVNLMNMQSPDSSVSAFSVIRDAFHCLNPNTPLMLVTISTFSDVIDLNKPPSDDSLRDPKRIQCLSPFILKGNRDTFQDIDYTKISVTESTISSDDMYRVLVSMGRPLWSSVNINGAVELACLKLKNGSWEGKSVVPHIAVWAIRTGLPVCPFSNVPNQLVKSHMGTLLWASESIKDLYVTYPSEPIMAIAAGRLTDENVKRSFKRLYQSAAKGYIDRGEFGEIIAAQIVLLSISRSEPIPHTATRIPEFPAKYRCKEFLTEATIEDVSGARTRTEPPVEPSPPSTALEAGLSVSEPMPLFEGLCQAYRVKSFLSRLCGGDSIVDRIVEAEEGRTVFPILDGVINATHFVRLNLKNFPHSDSIVNVEKKVISPGLLRLGLLRQCGFYMPSNNVGVDLIIPVLMTLENRPVYSYIPIQVKLPGGSLEKIAKKLDYSSHLIGVSDGELDLLLENQLGLFLQFNQRTAEGSIEVKSFLQSSGKHLTLVGIKGLSAFKKLDFLKNSVGMIEKILEFKPNLLTYAKTDLKKSVVFAKRALHDVPLQYPSSDPVLLAVTKELALTSHPVKTAVQARAEAQIILPLARASASSPGKRRGN